MDAQQLFKKIDNAKSLDFGDIFSNSIELFKIVWVQGMVHLLLSFAVMIPVMIIMYIIIFAIGFGFMGTAQYYTGVDNSGLMDSSFVEAFGIVGVVLLSLVFLFLIMIAVAVNFGIIAHFFIVCKLVDHEEPENSDYFMFVKRKYFKKILMLTLAIFGIAIVSYLLCFIPLLYVMVPLQLVSVIFAFNPELRVTDLIKASFRLGNKIWLIAFGLILVSGMLAQMIGFLLCGIGTLFTASFVYIPLYYMYKDGIGFEEKDDLDFEYDWLKEGES